MDNRTGRGFVLLLGAALLCASQRLSAERLPMRAYTIADGLPHDQVLRIVRDSRGFLWFCTREGLARFDGQRFSTFEAEPRLAGRAVFDVLEARNGIFWVATSDGLLRLAPHGLAGHAEPARFITGPTRSSRSTYRVIQDRAGTIWCGTSSGLYRLEQTAGRPALRRVDIGLPVSPYATTVSDLLEDHLGKLWIASVSGLYVRSADESVMRYSVRDGLPDDNTQSLLLDGNGHVWAASTAGLAEIENRRDRAAVIRSFGTADGLLNPNVRSLLQTSSGTIWAGTFAGLNELPDPTATKPALNSYSTSSGLIDRNVTSLAEDAEGNLWIGTEAGGAARISPDGMTTFLEPDGMSGRRIAQVLESRAGTLCVLSGSDASVDILEGRRFRTVRLPGVRSWGWGWYQKWLQDRAGDWWVATGDGLFRFAATDDPTLLEGARPKAVYTTRQGLYTNQVFRVFEDSRGDIWISNVGDVQSLSRWVRSTGVIERLPLSGEVLAAGSPTAFAEDRSGTIWIGFFNGGLARYAAGELRFFSRTDGLPAGEIRALHLDTRGSLWIATTKGGAARLDDLQAERPRFLTYTTDNGLSSNQILAVAGDRDGNIYLGTGRGVEQLDPGGRVVRRFTTADGLANNFVNVAYADRRGNVWFGTLGGLSRLTPRAEQRQRAAPIVLINGVSVAGVAMPTSHLGEPRIAPVELQSHRNQLTISFISPSFRAGERPRFQYRLDGADRSWSLPTEQQHITYAAIAPGSYRFEVRRLSDQDRVVSMPATFAFTVVAPVWRRWWFVSLVVTVLVTMMHMIYRIRSRRLVELERVRTRIATDLHDDIGASLSRIAIVSEVMRRDIDRSQSALSGRIGDIAESARELVDTMSDIVWSVDPRRDDFDSVVRRIREFASDVLEGQAVWTLEISPALRGVRLAPEQRRHLYLLLKESIHNIARHAKCTAVTITLGINGPQLQAEITDDGSGAIHSNGARRGLGMRSMEQRARELGGKLSITAPPEGGTRVLFTMPIRHGTA